MIRPRQGCSTQNNLAVTMRAATFTRKAKLPVGSDRLRSIAWVIGTEPTSQISPAARIKTTPLVRHDSQQRRHARESEERSRIKLPSNGLGSKAVSKGNGLKGQSQGNKFWLGILWKPEHLTIVSAPSKLAQRLLESNPKVSEVFGPFKSPSLIEARLQLRLIVSAIGFRVPASFNEI